MRLVRRESAGGPATARAAGLEAAGDCDLIALCDADDAWEPGKLAAQIAVLEERPDAGLCFGRATVVGIDGRATGEHWAEPSRARRLDELYESNPIPTSSVLLRRAALEAAGGFASPVHVAEDWELWLRVVRAGYAAVAAPDARIRYRRHPGGLTADVARLAAAQRVVHERHADAVDADLRDRVRASDARTLRAISWRRRLGRGRRAAY